MTIKMRQSKKMDDIPFSGIRKVFEAAGQLEKQGKDIINLGTIEYRLYIPKSIIAFFTFRKIMLNYGQIKSNYGERIRCALLSTQTESSTML